MANALPKSHQVLKTVSMKFDEYLLWRTLLLNTIQNENENRFTIFMSFNTVNILSTLDKGDLDFELKVGHFIEALETKLFKNEAIKKIEQFDEYIYRRFGTKSENVNEKGGKKIYEMSSIVMREFLDNSPLIEGEEKMEQILRLDQDPVPYSTVHSFKR